MYLFIRSRTIQIAYLYPYTIFFTFTTLLDEALWFVIVVNVQIDGELTLYADGGCASRDVCFALKQAT